MTSRPSLSFVIAAVSLVSLVAESGTAQRSNQRNRRDDPRPSIIRSAGGEWLVDLPPGAEDAIDRYDRDFQAWRQDDYARELSDDYQYSSRQTPWAVVGDFNGDGRTDVALAGQTERNAVVIVALSTGRTKYHVIEADAEPYDLDDPRTIRLPILKYMYPGRYVVRDQRLAYARELVVDQPALQVTGGNRTGAVLYVVDGETLAPYYLSTDPLKPPARPSSRPRRR